MFHAIHIVTESSDHYTLLIEASTVAEVVEEVHNRLGEELAFMSRFFCDSGFDPDIVDDVCREIVDGIYEKKDEIYQELYAEN